MVCQRTLPVLKSMSETIHRCGSVDDPISRPDIGPPKERAVYEGTGLSGSSAAFVLTAEVIKT